jgi:DNA-binding transcriptional LysR family regulator
MAQPTLGRQVDALESELGVILFERVGRGLTLTPSGHELLEHVRAMGEAATRLSLTSMGQSQAIEGVVRIAASEAHAMIVLPPILAKLRLAEPGIHIEIVASSTSSDLRRREADIAIRNYRPEEPDLIARKIRDIPARLYATPGYIERIGNPTRPGELSAADFINIDRTGVFLKGMQGLGIDLADRNFPIMTENYLVMWGMVKGGLGIGVQDSLIGDAEPLVRRVLPDLAPLTFSMWLVTHREVNTSRRLRVVYDLLVAELADQ